MGTDYYVRLVAGVPAKKIIQELITSEFIQDTRGGVELFNKEGKPIGIERQYSLYDFNGKEYDDFYALEQAVQDIGLTLNCHTNGSDLWDEDLIGIRVYSDKEMQWLGRRGECPSSGVTIEQIEKTLEKARFILCNLFPNKVSRDDIKVYTILEINS